MNEYERAGRACHEGYDKGWGDGWGIGIEESRALVDPPEPPLSEAYKKGFREGIEAGRHLETLDRLVAMEVLREEL